MKSERLDTNDSTTGAAADAETIDRPCERMASVGPQQLSDTELMALILGRPSLDLPTQLLTKLGGLRGIAEATEGEIRQAAHGIGPVRAAMIQAAIELGRRAVGERPRRGQRLGSASEVWIHYRARLAFAPVEEFWSIALDVRHRVMSERCAARGSLTGVEVHPRDVFAPLIRHAAAAVIFCHNHPSGDPTPSRQDIELTARLRQVGELVGITVLDHVVVAAEGYTSLADRGWS